jgi:hypothetical protein
METSVWLEIQSGLDLPHHRDLFLAVPACAAKQRELIGVGTGREQAEIFMRQQAKRDRGGDQAPRPTKVITLMPTNPRCKPQQ